MGEPGIQPIGLAEYLDMLDRLNKGIPSQLEGQISVPPPLEKNERFKIRKLPVPMDFPNRNIIPVPPGKKDRRSIPT